MDQNQWLNCKGLKKITFILYGYVVSLGMISNEKFQ